MESLTAHDGRRTGGRTRGSGRSGRNAPQAPGPAAAAGDDRSESAQDIAPVEPRRVSARAAATTISRLAANAATLDGCTRLRRLAGLVRKDGRNARQMAYLESAIGTCLDEAAAASSSDERWTACEAATWALAWMARTKRAGGSAGGLLERLVGQARAAQALLATGDSQPTRFILVLASLFADVEACRCLEAGAAATLAADLERLVSPAGVPSLNGSSAIVDRVVRWTAAREIARRSGEAAWSAASERSWRKAAGTAVRLLGGRGRALAAAGRMPEAWTARLLDAVEAGGGRRGRTARTLRRRRGPRDRRRLMDRDLHDAASGIAILRSGWDHRSVRLMLDYRHPVPRLEIAVADRLLVDGPWQWEAWADGRSLEPEARWEVACFESDRKATFLEITAPLGDGRRIERQVVMLPRERVVLLADAITAGTGGAGSLRYRGMLPLAASLDAEPSVEHRELVVKDVHPRMLALPLALGEWRTQAAAGSFVGEPGTLTLAQDGAHRLYAPLWLDCDARRVGRPLTWRQLTVADSRIILPRHQAVGYRVQCGLEQWLLYRALDAARNRTVLGCNVSCEFLVGRVRKSGEIARTLEIQ
ncbi:MAG: hypothetical protein ACKO4T_09275 [Planctomycetaceae bacterium]